MSIYKRCLKGGCFLESTCVGASRYYIEAAEKYSRDANRLKVIRVAEAAGILTKEEARRERRQPWYNPYSHYVSRTHVIYRHSEIDHFIRPL